MKLEFVRVAEGDAGLSEPLAGCAAMPPAPIATVRTIMRARFIRFTFQQNAATLPPPYSAVDQLFVKAWLMRRI
jgi:hypothetical protein